MQTPVVSRAQMIEIDRIMVEDLGVALLQMMENAGRSLAQLAIEVFTPKTVVVFCGSGGNGGGGMVAARHLVNRGIGVSVVLTRPVERLAGAARHQANILQAMGVPLGLAIDEESERGVDLVIDAILGYSLNGTPSGAAAAAIASVGALGAPILSLDCPSGMDVDSGQAPGDVVNPAATMTLALAKIGLVDGRTGDLYLADISVPREAYRQLGIEVPQDLFAISQIINL